MGVLRQILNAPSDDDGQHQDAGEPGHDALPTRARAADEGGREAEGGENEEEGEHGGFDGTSLFGRPADERYLDQPFAVRCFNLSGASSSAS